MAVARLCLTSDVIFRFGNGAKGKGYHAVALHNRADQFVGNTSDVGGQFGGQDAGFWGEFPSCLKN